MLAPLALWPSVVKKSGLFPVQDPGRSPDPFDFVPLFLFAWFAWFAV
jgi:hypothetical protein